MKLLNTIEVGGNILFSYVPRKLLFKEYHWSDRIKHPLFLTPRYIELGKRVYIGHHARIEGVEKYNEKCFYPVIRIHEGVSIQQNLHLTCANRIEIGKNTAIAANVTITDIHHPYTDVNIPIENQDIEVKEVVIGDDCKIYNGAVILPGIHVGRHVTIGANSVVTKSVPSYSVVVGAPAKVVKSFDKRLNKWQSVASEL